MMRCTFRRTVLVILILAMSWLLQYVVNKILDHRKYEPIHVATYAEVPNGAAKRHTILNVEVWGKAAIGQYFWEHIFQGVVMKETSYLLEHDELLIGDVHLNYKTGPYLTPHTVDKTIKNLVIILNGREPKKVDFARQWLEALLSMNNFRQLRNLGVIILGNEACENSWLNEYLNDHPDIFRFLYVVYDIPNFDNKRIFQWPLGVATYREFPSISKISVEVEAVKLYKCNFLGTVYPGSSREILYKILQKHGTDFNCYTKVRFEWLPNENSTSMDKYQLILKQSDLTLCPVGKNSEAYRIYEAMSYGSVPVVEDFMTPGQCNGGSDTANSSPYRLLKQYGAPIIYVKDWTELKRVIEEEKRLTYRQIMKRRTRVLEWYQKFKYDMREHFLATLKNTFRQ